MLTVLSAGHWALPIEDPVLKFLVILIIILAAPLLLNKIKVPHLIGLIIAGAIIGPNGFGILPRDASVVVIGTTGLLFIMFLAGLEIDLQEFKKNKWKSLGFGLFTFSIPLILGVLAGHFILGFNYLTSVLFASIFSSHTLISYPIVSQLGLSKNPAVNITIGGTMITDLLALLVLAVIVGMSQGDVTSAFWIQLSISILVFGAIVLIGFPYIARWFFKNVDDKVSHFIFVMVMIYLAGLFAELAGVEAIIGAFLAGLALNRLIPHTSTLMNRIDFVGNAIFIPFFLISVGMIIDFQAFIKDFETIKVALIMTSLAIGGKYLASVATQKTFRLKKDEGQLIFGLSTASAAATLAAVMVGYNVILGETETGEPIRLLNESILNGSILLILVSCTVSSFVSQKSAAQVAERESQEQFKDDNPEAERILLALNYAETVDPMTNFALLAKAKSNKDQIFALNVINEVKNESSDQKADKLLASAVDIGAGAEVKITPLKRHDSDIINGINNELKEHKITDLIIGVDREKGFSSSFVYNLYNGYLSNNTTNVLVYHAAQPTATIKTYHAVIPPLAQKEVGFLKAVLKVWNLARNSGAQIVFYSDELTVSLLEKIQKKVAIEASYIIFNRWSDIPKIAEKMKSDEGLILIMAKRGQISYLHDMVKVPTFLQENFVEKNYLLIYPATVDNSQDSGKYNTIGRSHNSPDDYRKISQMIAKLFK